MENPLVLLLLFAYLIVIIVSGVNLAWNITGSDRTAIEKAILVALLGSAFFLGVYLFNRTVPVVRLLLLVGGAMIIGTQGALWRQHRRKRKGKEPTSPAALARTALLIGALAFLFVWLASDLLNRLMMF